MRYKQKRNKRLDECRLKGRRREVGVNVLIEMSQMELQITAAAGKRKQERKEKTDVLSQEEEITGQRRGTTLGKEVKTSEGKKNHLIFQKCCYQPETERLSSEKKSEAKKSLGERELSEHLTQIGERSPNKSEDRKSKAEKEFR